MKTAELAGALLDYWVARAEGLEALVHAQAGCCIEVRDENGLAEWEEFAPSKNWAKCGPLIEKHEIQMNLGTEPAGILVAYYSHDGFQYSADLKEAICRAVVCKEFDDEVPDQPQ